jgi:hypothetical protein
MAQQLEGHAPEVNQFALVGGPDHKPEFDQLVSAAVMHLALVRTIATKRGDETDVKAYDYSLHPIFAPFFVFSHRKKRKMKVSEDQILGLASTSASETIRDVLKENGRLIDEDLPEQLLLFGKYYGLNI